MKRPDVEKSLEALKLFQRATVEHAFHRLYKAPDGTGRFLVADEVGLGKTLVARGIVARAIDHLWEDVDRIDVIYICSNAAIARANLHKLLVGGAEERRFASATRLTMLATELAPRDGESGPADGKLNFFSFTPGTSFTMGKSAGQWQERVVLFHMLEPLVGPPRTTALMNFLQAYIRDKDWWRARLREPMPIHDGTRARFETAFRTGNIEGRLCGLLDASFRRYRERWPAEIRRRQMPMIAELREVLAGACLDALEPDLIILDEFQRFRSLIDTAAAGLDIGVELAKKLFEARPHDGRRVRTLLLSATPYKAYTADAEIGHEDHYQDFLDTTRFLLGDDESRVDELRNRLACFGSALRGAVSGPLDAKASNGIAQAKQDVEAVLRDVMARTERVSAGEDADAMLQECRKTAPVTAGDVRQYLAADALFRAVGDRDPMRFWKSAPYLAHFMRDYRFNRLLEEARSAPDRIVTVLRRHDSAFLKRDALRKWKRLDPGHAKLRELAAETLDADQWRLLWIPPTAPYWPLEGPFAGMGQTTKRLLFSAWNVVPDAVSAVLSYEAERRMFGGRLSSYENPERRQRPLLRFTSSGADGKSSLYGRRSDHRLLLLLLPCLFLADRAHPLAAPAGMDRRTWVRERVDELLKALPNPASGAVDYRWEWAAPFLLDRGLRAFLRAWRDGKALPGPEGESLPRPNPESFPAYLDDLLEIDPEKLGRRPPNLAELVTEVALGSPAILALRSMRAGAAVGDDTRRRLAVRIAHAFWSLFNRPAVIALLRRLAGGSAGRTESVYWRLVLQYCRQGNLQAVLDEHWHLLREQESWSEGACADAIADTCARKLADAVHPIRARVHASFFRQEESGPTAEDEAMRVRTVFALRFGHLESEDDQGISQDRVRAAFNSPFRPFVLASTSIGQEGLDFHPWCHRVIHWNLPGNPVDLEQREGRVHRYKGHAVRRNVAAAHARDVLASWRCGNDLWASMFEAADGRARADGAGDLRPHWIAPGEHCVQRHVPQLPRTTEIEAFGRLKRQLAAYRVVFGQPRQEELLALLDRAKVDVEQLGNWAVDLSPPERRRTSAA